jgi:hypothetical protein
MTEIQKIVGVLGIILIGLCTVFALGVMGWLFSAMTAAFVFCVILAVIKRLEDGTWL